MRGFERRNRVIGRQYERDRKLLQKPA